MFSSSTVTERGIQEIRKDMEQQNPVYMTIYMSPYIRVASSLDVNNFSINLFLFECCMIGKILPWQLSVLKWCGETKSKRNNVWWRPTATKIVQSNTILVKSSITLLFCKGQWHFPQVHYVQIFVLWKHDHYFIFAYCWGLYCA